LIKKHKLFIVLTRALVLLNCRAMLAVNKRQLRYNVISGSPLIKRELMVDCTFVWPPFITEFFIDNDTNGDEKRLVCRKTKGKPTVNH